MNKQMRCTLAKKAQEAGAVTVWPDDIKILVKGQGPRYRILSILLSLVYPVFI